MGLPKSWSVWVHGSEEYVGCLYEGSTDAPVRKFWGRLRGLWGVLRVWWSVVAVVTFWNARDVPNFGMPLFWNATWKTP